MAASFNRSSWFLKGDVVSTDLRVLNNRGNNDIGLTGFGPNINTVKDVSEQCQLIACPNEQQALVDLTQRDVFSPASLRPQLSCLGRIPFIASSLAAGARIAAPSSFEQIIGSPCFRAHPGRPLRGPPGGSGAPLYYLGHLWSTGNCVGPIEHGI